MGYHYRESGYGGCDFLITTAKGQKEGGLPIGIIIPGGVRFGDKKFDMWIQEQKDFYIYPVKHSDTDQREVTHITKTGFVNRFGYFITKENLFANANTNYIDIIDGSWFTRKNARSYVKALKSVFPEQKWNNSCVAANENIIDYANRMARNHYRRYTYDHAVRVADYVRQNELIPNDLQEKCQAVAYMHDLLEDTDYEIPEAVRQEYPDIDEALELLTKPSGMSYDEYCNQINVYASTSVGGQIAYWVKLADMKDHLSQKETLTEHLKEKYLSGLAKLL